MGTVSTLTLKHPILSKSRTYVPTMILTTQLSDKIKRLVFIAEPGSVSSNTGREYQTLRRAIALQKICCSQSPQAVPACPCSKGRIDRDAVLGSREVKVMGRARSEYVAEERNRAFGMQFELG